MKQWFGKAHGGQAVWCEWEKRVGRFDSRFAKLSLVLLTGCKSRSGEGSGRSLARANHPRVSSVAPLAESVVNGRDTVANVNNRGEEYKEYLAGQKGVAPP